MTMTMATIPATPPPTAFARLPVARASDEARARPDDTDAPAADASAEATTTAAATQTAPRGQVSDLTPASAGTPATPPTFADVIANLADADAPPASTETAKSTGETADHDTDSAADACSTTFAAVVTLPAVQAALGLVVKSTPAAVPVGEGAAEGRPECRGQVGDLTPISASGAASAPVTGTHAAPRAAMDVAAPAPGIRQRAEDASAGTPPAATPVPAAVLLATPDATAAFSRLAGSEVLALRGAEPAQWRPALKEALGERLQVQVGSRSEQAVIRLDPPQLGRIEIVVRHEGGHLQVHLAASNGDVLRQLHTLTEGLRQDLVHRHHGEVAVSVSDLAREGGGNARREREAAEDRERTPGRALAEAEGGTGHDAFAHLQDRE